MPDDNIPPCHCGMKWRRKCRDKRKNRFDLEAFVNDSPFGLRMEWFSSFTALYVCRYRETTPGGPKTWDAIIWQDNIADMPLAFMIVKEMVEKKLSYSYNMNISISQLFQRQIPCNHLWGWSFRFCCHSALIFLLLETSCPWKIQKNFKIKKKFSIILEMASYQCQWGGCITGKFSI